MNPNGFVPTGSGTRWLPGGLTKESANEPLQTWRCVVSFWHVVRREMLEVVWLASIVGGLSALSVALAFVAAMTLDG